MLQLITDAIEVIVAAIEIVVETATEPEAIFWTFIFLALVGRDLFSRE